MFILSVSVEIVCWRYMTSQDVQEDIAAIVVLFKSPTIGMINLKFDLSL